MVRTQKQQKPVNEENIKDAPIVDNGEEIAAPVGEDVAQDSEDVKDLSNEPTIEPVGEEVNNEEEPDGINDETVQPVGPIDAEDAPTVVKGDNIPEHLQIIEEERLPEFEIKKPILAEKCWVPTNEYPDAVVAEKLF